MHILYECIIKYFLSVNDKSDPIQISTNIFDIILYSQERHTRQLVVRCYVVLIAQ